MFSKASFKIQARHDRIFYQHHQCDLITFIEQCHTLYRLFQVLFCNLNYKNIAEFNLSHGNSVQL